MTEYSNVPIVAGRFPGVKSGTHGLNLWKPSDWQDHSASRFHPPGFLDWLECLPELKGVPTETLSGSSVRPGWHHLPARSEKPVDPPAGLPGQLFSTFRDALFNPEYTSCYRLVHGVADGWDGWFADRWGDVILVSSEKEFSAIPDNLLDYIKSTSTRLGTRSVYFQRWEKAVRGVDTAALSPVHVSGQKIQNPFPVMENGLQYNIRFDEGYSVGIFTDHRDNRRRWIDRYIQPDWEIPSEGHMLNTFAYTCGFSLAAAKAGWITTSLDLSKKYIQWGEENFLLNNIPTSGHDFVFGDAFEWMMRLIKRKKQFDAVVLDPPTFSKSRDSRRKSRIFRADKDFPELARLAATLVRPGGIILASTNARTMAPMAFLKMLGDGLAKADREIGRVFFSGQGPDYPLTHDQMPHLKSFWIEVL